MPTDHGERQTAVTWLPPKNRASQQQEDATNKWMPQWVWKRPMAHWAWAVMWVLLTWCLRPLFGGWVTLAGNMLMLLPLGILIRSAYRERRAWGRWTAVFATVAYGGLAVYMGLVQREVTSKVLLAILGTPFGALALYGFWHEKKLTSQCRITA